MLWKTPRRQAAHETGKPSGDKVYLAVLYSFSEIEVKVMRIFWTDFFQNNGRKTGKDMQTEGSARQDELHVEPSVLRSVRMSCRLRGAAAYSSICLSLWATALHRVSMSWQDLGEQPVACLAMA